MNAGASLQLDLVTDLEAADRPVGALHQDLVRSGQRPGWERELLKGKILEAAESTDDQGLVARWDCPSRRYNRLGCRRLDVGLPAEDVHHVGAGRRGEELDVGLTGRVVKRSEARRELARHHEMAVRPV